MALHISTSVHLWDAEALKILRFQIALRTSVHLHLWDAQVLKKSQFQLALLGLVIKPSTSAKVY